MYLYIIINNRDIINNSICSTLLYSFSLPNSIYYLVVCSWLSGLYKRDSLAVCSVKGLSVLWISDPAAFRGKDGWCIWSGVKHWCRHTSPPRQIKQITRPLRAGKGTRVIIVWHLGNDRSDISDWHLLPLAFSSLSFPTFLRQRLVYLKGNDTDWQLYALNEPATHTHTLLKFSALLLDHRAVSPKMSSKERKKKRLDDLRHAAASKILTMTHLVINQCQSFKTGISGVYSI